jgi:hypothetical protein
VVLATNPFVTLTIQVADRGAAHGLGLLLSSDSRN